MTINASIRQRVAQAVDQYELPLLRYAQRLLGRTSLGEDAVQHAFLRYCSKAEEVEPTKVKAWLFTVCRNKALDFLRREGKVAPLEQPEAIPQTSTDPVAAAEDAETAQLLHELVERLPPSQREVVHLWAAGFSYREISAVTNRRESSIRVLVHRGVTRLREHPGVQSLLCDSAASE